MGLFGLIWIGAAAAYGLLPSIMAAVSLRAAGDWFFPGGGMAMAELSAVGACWPSGSVDWDWDWDWD